MERVSTHWRSRLARPRLFALLLVGAILAASPGCRKTDDSPAAPPVSPSPMPEAEQERGLKACRAYAERVCRCAKADPSLAEDCALAHSRPASLEGALEVVNDGYGRLAVNDQIATQTTARAIIDRCFEADAKLDPATCPRESSEDAPAPGAGAAAPAGAGPGAAGDPSNEDE